ncbi:TonB-dependent receptor [Burkholderiaceae bacterium DAT-1]|nr:TonB-dependent receptor [Burkholderiaceae bacterium DAT-1]
MPLHHTTHFRLSTLTASCLMALPIFAQAVYADSVNDESKASDSKRVQAIEVTGSRIRRTSNETPSPVQSISSEALKESGYSSLADVLHNVTANNMGSLTQANPGAFAAGGSGISLRGLTVGATLVLINGHRMASYPMPDDGQRDFVDIASIPFDAIERIEILKDGASAVYGSDAMAGVVNVILKKSFKGTTLNAESGQSTKHDGKTTHLSLTTGFGSEDDRQNGFVSLEYRHQDPVLLINRPYLANADWTAWGGQDLTPMNGKPADADGTPLATDCKPCGPGNTRYTIQPKTENVNVLARFNRQLTDDWHLSLQGSLFTSKAKQETVYNALDASGLVSFNFQPGGGVRPYDPDNFPYVITLPANNPMNRTGEPMPFSYNFPDVGPQTQELRTISSRFVAELSGNYQGWDMDASLGVTRVRTNMENRNYLSIPGLQRALNDGSYVVGAYNRADVLARVAPSASSTSTNELDFFSLHGTRPLMDLPGGALSVATGVDVVHRNLNEQFPGSFARGEQYHPIYSFAIGKQTVSAAFIELVAPITRQLELEAAARIDHYDTYGSSTTPKLGFKYNPLDNLVFRGTYAEGFRAPNPAEIGNSGSTSGALVPFYDPKYCAGGTPADAYVQANYDTFCSINPPQEQLPNAHLQPEKSRSYTLGMVFEPTNWFNLSVDYYDIKLRNQIIAVGLLGQQQFDHPELYGSIIYRTTAPMVDAATGKEYFPIVYETYPFINASSTHTSGVDIDARLKFNLGEWGKLTAATSYTHVSKFDMSYGGKTYSIAGTHGPSFVSGDTGAPQTRIQETLTWNRGPVELSTTVNYTSGISVLDPTIGSNSCTDALSGEFNGATPPSQFCTVDAFTTVNLQGRYKVNKQLSLFGSVTNVFDRHAPYDLQTTGAAGYGANYGGAAYNPALHQDGAIGRYINLGVTYSF